MRAVVIDDERPSRIRLEQLLATEPDVDIVAQCTTGAEAIAAISELRPDVAFLDIQMPDMNGFEVLASLEPADVPLVVFVTAYDEYAVRAFDVLALDYLLKPIAPERLAATCARARSRLTNNHQSVTRQQQFTDLLEQLERDARVMQNGGTRAITNRLLVRVDDRVVMIKTDEIKWIEAAGNYVRIHCDRSQYIVRESLTRLESVLDRERFARIHRSTIINLDRVKELQPWMSGEMLVIMEDGKQLKLSRTYRRQFEQYNRIFS